MRPERWQTEPGRLALMLAVGAALGAAAHAQAADTATPIQHLVVIYQENVSFDHYFATYPRAANPPGEPAFHARPGTPSVNGLTAALLTNNPNAAQPFRLDRSRAATCDQDHNYKAEQQGYNAGLVNKAVESMGTGAASRSGNTPCSPTDVMGYFDGNTVTALWNYAQYFAMNDNHFGTTFGPSTPGALNLVSGQTHGATPSCALVASGCTATSDFLSVGGSVDVIQGTVISDAQPAFDDCSSRETVAMSGPNVGDLLNRQGITWGFFQGGFKPTAMKNGKAVCGASHTGSDGRPKGDYIPHHQPFQYYRSTSNPHHLPPTSPAMVGRSDQANHQYDLSDFWTAVAAGNLPAVSFLKAAAFQDGHAGYSDPLAEQRFIVDTINRLQQLPQWKDTAVVIAYDDSDGWYDHVMPPIVNTSATSEDALTSEGACGGSNPDGIQGRCGYGPRLPLLVISPWANQNFVDHSLTDQSSILRFIEDNWRLGRLGGGSFDALAGSIENMFDFRHPLPRRVFLDPNTGLVTGLDDEGNVSH
ncbi:MAG TPA: alkaline phosphatase family protein [Burkholderiales bacterium]|nr:alkaline phosphatase family protein [Burkholderiales bacterium]